MPLNVIRKEMLFKKSVYQILTCIQVNYQRFTVIKAQNIIAKKVVRKTGLMNRETFQVNKT